MMFAIDIIAQDYCCIRIVSYSGRTQHCEEQELVKKGTIVRCTSANSTKGVTAYLTLNWELSVAKLTRRSFQGAVAEASETARMHHPVFKK